MAGADVEARTYLERSRQRHEELGLTFSRAHWTVLSGMALLYVGDVEAAEAELRWGYQTLRDMGERAALSTVAAYLARVLVAERRYAEAEALTVESEHAAAVGDLASQIAWRASDALNDRAATDSFGCLRIPHQAVNATINTPGTSPPRNIFSIVTLFALALAAPRLAIAELATMEYKITGRQGGNSNPSEPAPVSRPSASRSE